VQTELSQAQIQEIYKMDLYIQLIGNQPVNHPLVKENVQSAFPDVDFNNLPNWLAKFERVPTPIIGPYEKNQRNVYEFVGEIVKDVWYADPMTNEEIIEKQNQTKESWEEYGFSSWIFNETTCEFDPPAPYPIDTDINYYWDEDTISWLPINDE
jgi:hypothetical protein